MSGSSQRGSVAEVLRATVTPLASILGSGLLIIVPVLEETLGGAALFGAIGVCVLAWFVGTVIRHNVAVVEPAEEDGTLDPVTARLDRISDAIIVVAYVISVALYLRIMAQYVVGFAAPDAPGSVERVIAVAAVVLIVGVGIARGFDGLNLLDTVSLVAVLALTAVLSTALFVHDARGWAREGSLDIPAVPSSGLWTTLAVLGGIVITVQGFETVRFLGSEFPRDVRIRASRVAQLVAASIYIGFVAVATPSMGLGTSAGADQSLLDITDRIAPLLALPLVLSAVLSQFSAAVADTAAADGNLRGLASWMTGVRPFLLSGAAAIALAATVPTYTVVALASRAFAAYYACQAVIALRTSTGLRSKLGYGTLAAVMVAITVLAQPAG